MSKLAEPNGLDTPVASPATPVASPAAPVASPAAPVASPVAPVASPATPVASPATPVASPVAPVASPATVLSDINSLLTETMNKKQTTKRMSKTQKKKMMQREQLWGNEISNKLWDRTTQVGFTTIPRTMPIILQIMDDLADKGKPVSVTYFNLWCRVFDESFIEIKSNEELSFEAGFSGQRAVSTWRQRMKKLVELGFIDAKPGASGEYNYVLIFNPYLIIKNNHLEGKIQEHKYNALFGRAMDIGATDLN